LKYCPKHTLRKLREFSTHRTASLQSSSGGEGAKGIGPRGRAHAKVVRCQPEGVPNSWGGALLPAIEILRLPRNYPVLRCHFAMTAPLLRLLANYPMTQRFRRYGGFANLLAFPAGG
jgi:hypothetical protein